VSNDPINIEADDPGSLGLHTLTDAVFMTGLSAASLRNYERDGLIRPLRTAKGTRLYRMQDLELAKQIYKARMQRTGATGIRRTNALS
jgi:DNA-binding transcriptional MerR regulator